MLKLFELTLHDRQTGYNNKIIHNEPNCMKKGHIFLLTHVCSGMNEKISIPLEDVGMEIFLTE